MENENEKKNYFLFRLLGNCIKRIQFNLLVTKMYKKYIFD